MAADVMQGCRPGSAQLLGGLGSRLRSGVLSLSLFTLRVARFLFLFCFRARGAYRPAATRAQKFCKQVSFFRPVFACAHLFVSRFLVCARVQASDVSWNDFFIRHLHLSRTLATSSSLFARCCKWCLQHLLWSRCWLHR